MPTKDADDLQDDSTPLNVSNEARSSCPGKSSFANGDAKEGGIHRDKRRMTVSSGNPTWLNESQAKGHMDEQQVVDLDPTTESVDLSQMDSEVDGEDADSASGDAAGLDGDMLMDEHEGEAPSGAMEVAPEHLLDKNKSLSASLLTSSDND